MNRRLLSALTLLGILGAGSALACTIPVFRFALDRWEADPFRLVIPAALATRPDAMKLLIPLRGNGEANVRIVEDNTATESRLLFPHDDYTLWTGNLDAASLPAVLDSPARQELVRRILAGDSAVWVVCAPAGDDGLAGRIEKRLRFLEQAAALPPQDPRDPDSQLGPGPALALKFSVLRISQDNPAEKLFAAMLAGPAHGNFLAEGKAFAAPVFGKGRVLGSWTAEELDDSAVEDASLFLIGRCSCRVKNENPGWDVVLKVDWERALAQAGKPVSLEAAEPEIVKTTPLEMGGNPSGPRWAWIGLIAAVFAVAGWLWRHRGRA